MYSDQKGSAHLTITVQSSGVQRFFDHPVQVVQFFRCLKHSFVQGDQKVSVHLTTTLKSLGAQRRPCIKVQVVQFFRCLKHSFYSVIKSFCAPDDYIKIIRCTETF